jgi:hypothetical protein
MEIGKNNQILINAKNKLDEKITEKKNNEKEKIIKMIKKEVDEYDQISYLLSEEKNISNELKKELTFKKDGQTLIRNKNPELHQDTIIAIIREINKNQKKPVLILTKDSHQSIIKKLNKKNVLTEEIIFLDTISKSYMGNTIQKNVYYLDSLENLTQLQIMINKITDANKEITFIFDTIDILELFHNEKIITKFFYSFTRLMNIKNKDCYYLISKETIMPKISQFFDKLITLEKRR